MISLHTTDFSAVGTQEVGVRNRDMVAQAPTCLRPYQVPHAEHLLKVLNINGAALDASDTGTGKMYVACHVAKVMDVVPLVIAPKSTLAEWRKVAAGFNIEIEAVGYEKVRGRRGRNSDYTVTDWGMEIPSGKGSRWVWRNDYALTFFDEVHRCGGMTSLASKLLIASKRQSQYVLTSSATAANDPRQLKALGYALGLFQLRDFKWWLLKHGCEPGLWGGFELTDDPEEQLRAMAKISREIFPARGARMRKEEIPGFPKTQVGVRLLQDETGKAKVWAQKIADAYSGQHLKLLTAARQEIELLKVPFFVDMAEDAARSSKVIIFVNYRNTVAALRPALESLFGKVPVIDGDNDEVEREEIKVAFQNNEFPVLIANNQAGGVGIGLHDPTGQVERTSIISPCYNPKDMKQVLGRPQRDGGAFSRQFFTYFADTIEEKVAQSVQRNLQNIDALNDAILNGVYA